jgi:hypothetical protein
MFVLITLNNSQFFVFVLSEIENGVRLNIFHMHKNKY